jgi:protease I
VRAFRHLDRAGSYALDRTLDAAAPGDCDAPVPPGGVANADALRMDGRAVEFARDFAERETVIGVVCHGPWLLVEADVLRGTTITSWPSLATDIRNAGGASVDAQVCRTDNLVLSRKPQDLEAFCGTVVDVLAAARVG